MSNVTTKDAAESGTANSERIKPRLEIKENNKEFMKIAPTTLKYISVTVRPYQRDEFKEDKSIKDVFSKIGKKAKNVLDDKIE